LAALESAAAPARIAVATAREMIDPRVPCTEASLGSKLGPIAAGCALA
jgi:hypothetical protein